LVRFFRPGLLSIIGTSGPFALAWLFLTTFPPTHSGGSESSLAAALGLFFGIVIGAWGLLLLGLAIGLFVDPAHSRIWGPIVAFFYGIGYIPLLILYGAAFSSNLQTAIIGITGTTTYVLGFAGGVWGLFSRSKWTRSGIGRGLVGSFGRIIVGGLIGFWCWLVIPQDVTIFLVPPLVLVVGGALLRKSSTWRPVFGKVLLGASIATGLQVLIYWSLLYLGTYRLGTFGELLVALVASVLAGSGAVSLVRRRSPDIRAVNPKPV